MQKKIVKEQDKLLEHLKNTNNKHLIKEILEEILNLKIYNIKYYGIEKFEKIPEYNFKLLKLKVLLENQISYNIYLKLINKYKIKETIFCYWYFCEEKYTMNNYKKYKYYAKKATITEYKNQLYSKKLNMQILNDKSIKNSNLHFIELDKYIKNNFKGKRIESNFIKQSENILFIGII